MCNIEEVNPLDRIKSEILSQIQFYFTVGEYNSKDTAIKLGITEEQLLHKINGEESITVNFIAQIIDITKLTIKLIPNTT